VRKSNPFGHDSNNTYVHKKIIGMNWNYITGFFDADGSITYVRNNKGDRLKTLQISFHNNEKVVLEDIRNFILKDLNVRGSICTKKAQKEAHQDQYELKYLYDQAYQVSKKLKTIQPKKKHRIKVYKKIKKLVKRNGKYSDKDLEQFDKLDKEFFDF